jgi:hypothetical protein
MLIFTQPYYADSGISVTLNITDNAPPSSQVVYYLSAAVVDGAYPTSQLVNALTITQNDNAPPYSATR